MNKHDQLFIRACKSKDPEKRLYSVLNRLYLRNTTPEFKRANLMVVLAEVCDRNLPISNTKLVIQVLTTPVQELMGGATEHTHNKFIRVLTAHLRYSLVSDPGFTVPAIIRNWQK